MTEVLTGTERLFLAGPPCSGKSAAGRAAGTLLEMPFLDLDLLIAKRAGTDIPGIFREHGEEGFRRKESEALKIVTIIEISCITALGGGCLLLEENLRMVLRNGILITLLANEDVLISRGVQQTGQRPLGGSEEEQRSLLRERMQHYSSLPNPIDTTDLTVTQTAELICQLYRKLRQ